MGTQVVQGYDIGLASAVNCHKERHVAKLYVVAAPAVLDVVIVTRVDEEIERTSWMTLASRIARLASTKRQTRKMPKEMPATRRAGLDRRDEEL